MKNLSKEIVIALISFFLSIIFILYMRIKLNPLIIFGGTIIIYKLQSDFFRAKEKFKKTYFISLIIISLFLALSIVICKHIQVNFNNLNSDITECYFNNFSILDIGAILALTYICVIGYTMSFLFIHEKLEKIESFSEIPIGVSNRKTLLLIALIIFCCWLPYFGVYYPGIIYGDSLSSIYEVVKDVGYSNHHPIFYTLFIGLCIRIGSIISDITFGCALYTLIQMAYISWIFSYSICWLKRKEVSTKTCIIITIFYAVSSCFPQHAISMWKDPIFSSTLVFYGLKLFDLVLSRGELFKQRNFILQYIFCFLVISLSRNNGIYILVFCTLCVIAALKIKRITLRQCNKFLRYSTALIVFILILTDPIYDIAGIKKDGIESYGIPLQQMARTVVYKGDMNIEETEFLNNLLPLEKYQEKYRPSLVDPIKWAPEFNGSYFEAHKTDFIKTWFSLLIKNPKIYIESWILNTYGFWSLNLWELNYFTSNIGYGDLTCIQTWDNCGIQPKNLLANQTFDFTKVFSLFTPMPAIGLCTWLMIIMLLYAIHSKKLPYFILFTPALGNLLTIFVATPIAYWPRYAFASIILLPMYFIFPFICKKL